MNITAEHALKSSEAPDQPQVSAALSSLRDAQERADKHLALLMDRLSGVVRPPLNDRDSELASVRPDMSPLAEELWSAAYRTNSLADRLASFGDRIDL